MTFDERLDQLFNHVSEIQRRQYTFENANAYADLLCPDIRSSPEFQLFLLLIQFFTPEKRTEKGWNNLGDLLGRAASNCRPLAATYGYVFALRCYHRTKIGLQVLRVTYKSALVHSEQIRKNIIAKPLGDLFSIWLDCLKDDSSNEQEALAAAIRMLQYRKEAILLTPEKEVTKAMVVTANNDLIEFTGRFPREPTDAWWQGDGEGFWKYLARFDLAVPQGA